MMNIVVNTIKTSENDSRYSPKWNTSVLIFQFLLSCNFKPFTLKDLSIKVFN